MKKKWLAVLLIVLAVLLVVPTISSCSCGGPGNDGTTDSGNEGEGGGNVWLPDEDTSTIPLPSGTVAPIVKYLRIGAIGNNSVTIKFNAIGSDLVYDIRYSDKEITSENFASATAVTAKVAGDDEVKTVIIDGLNAGKENRYFIGVQAKTADGKGVSTLETVRAGGIEVVKLDPKNIAAYYAGEAIRDLTALFDEQEVIIYPLGGNAGELPSNRVRKFYYGKGELAPGALDPNKENDERYGTNFMPIVDLQYVHYVDCIMLYYSQDAYDVIVRSSRDEANFNTPADWETNQVFKKADLKTNAWNKIEIGKETRYVQIEYLDGEAPTEIIVYGYQLCESEGMEIGNTQHKLPTVGELIGACGLLGSGAGYCTLDQLSCVTVLREYHNFGWSYNASTFPKKSTLLTRTNLGNFDDLYEKHSKQNLIVPCIQWNDDTNPAKTYNPLTGKLNSTNASWEEKYLPSTYIAFADNVYQFAARYGSSKMGYLYDTVRAHSDGGDRIGLNYLKWIELGNEPNGENQLGYTPYQLAALTSASYDGHMRTVLSDVYGSEDYSYFLGGKNADPDIKLAMAGLAGVGDRYITAMCYWMRANRVDDGTWDSKNDSIAMDAFNVHTYFGKYYVLNGQGVYVGVSPEEYGLADALSGLVEYRDKYYPDVEVWITEFGWDVNQSYETMTSCHAYGSYTPRQVQAMWLTRAYLLLSSLGVDKATMYMLEDAAYSNEDTAIGKYGTCGIYAYCFDDDGRLIWVDEDGVEWVSIDGKYVAHKDHSVERPAEKGGYGLEAKYEPRDSYYYLCTLKNTLNDMTFVRELDTGNPDVWVYQYADAKGNTGYAVWCPTSNETYVNNFKLQINASSALLIETDAANGSKTGVGTNLTAENGYVTIDVSENPVYVMVGPSYNN